MKEYLLSIITLEGKLFEESIESLSAPGIMGSFGILPNHAPFVTRLKKGLVKIGIKGSLQYFAVSEGILEVQDSGEVLLLSDEALQAKDQQEASEKLKLIHSD